MRDNLFEIITNSRTFYVQVNAHPQTGVPSLRMWVDATPTHPCPCFLFCLAACSSSVINLVPWSVGVPLHSQEEASQTFPYPGILQTGPSTVPEDGGPVPTAAALGC